MLQVELFRAALCLSDPWIVTFVRFEAGKDGVSGELHVGLDFGTGARFACPECGKEGLEVHDTKERDWRHLDFFQHQAYLHGRVPRVRCPECGVHLVRVPWARAGSGFTLLFEAIAVTLSCAMPVLAVSRQLRIRDGRIWRILRAYVDTAREELDESDVKKIGVDETSRQKGHKYVTIFADLEKGRVLFVTPGKDQTTFDAFLEDLKKHGGKPENVTDAVMDLSAAFTAGAEASFPNAELTYDNFHVFKLVGDAVDQTRRKEVASRPELKGTRYVFLKNPMNLTKRQRETWDELKDASLKTVKAYQLRLALKDIWDNPSENTALQLGRWIGWALRSRVEPIVKAAQTIRKHVPKILRVIQNGLTNGLMEGINSLVQAARAKARGYRNVENFITIIYLIAGKLDFQFTHTK